MANHPNQSSGFPCRCSECEEWRRSEQYRQKANPRTMTIAQELEQELLESLRSGFLFDCHDEPLDDAGKRLVRVVQKRIRTLTETAALDASFIE